MTLRILAPQNDFLWHLPCGSGRRSLLSFNFDHLFLIKGIYESVVTGWISLLSLLAVGLNEKSITFMSRYFCDRLIHFFRCCCCSQYIRFITLIRNILAICLHPTHISPELGKGSLKSSSFLGITLFKVANIILTLELAEWFIPVERDCIRHYDRSGVTWPTCRPRSDTKPAASRTQFPELRWYLHFRGELEEPFLLSICVSCHLL